MNFIRVLIMEGQIICPKLLLSAYSTNISNNFKINIDRHNGVHLHLENCNLHLSKNFSHLLEVNLNDWVSKGHSSAWIHIPIHLSSLISDTIKFNFLFHHAEDKMAVVCRWLLANQKSRLPPYATHQLGVAGCVYDAKTNSVLLVKDKHAKLTHSFWKFPGGLAELGEDIGLAAIREVFEETSIKTEFNGILAFRQHHNFPGAFSRSDIYFFCLMQISNCTSMPTNQHIPISDKYVDNRERISDTQESGSGKVVDKRFDLDEGMSNDGQNNLNGKIFESPENIDLKSDRFDYSINVRTPNIQSYSRPPQPVPCPKEIDACDWFDLNYLLANQNLTTQLTTNILRLIGDGDLKLMQPTNFKTILGTDSVLFSFVK